MNIDSELDENRFELNFYRSRSVLGIFCIFDRLMALWHFYEEKKKINK